MSCKHISVAKDNAVPYKNGTYFVSDLKCKKCGKDWTVLLNMTPNQIRIDKELTDTIHA